MSDKLKTIAVLTKDWNNFLTILMNLVIRQIMLLDFF